MKSVLVENLNPATCNLVEQVDAQKNMYLSGIMMQADLVNGNGRKYPLEEIKKAVEYAATCIKNGSPILGELNHPPVLTIDPKNVSHCITEVRMDGANAIGKMKILNTPNGQIVKAILEGGVRLGVSSRGTGNVTNEGIVSDFNFVTVDIVSQPSAPDAYPNMVREAQETNRIVTLAEAVCHDDAAQKYLKKELKSFIEALLTK